MKVEGIFQNNGIINDHSGALSVTMTVLTEPEWSLMMPLF